MPKAMPFRKKNTSLPRTLPSTGGGGMTRGGKKNSQLMQQENINARTPANSRNRGVVLPAASEVPSYFTIQYTIASGTNVDYYLFDGDGVVLAALGATQGANATVTMNGSANLYTALIKTFTKEQIQVIGIDYYSSTSDHKDLYVVTADFDGAYSRKPIFTLSGKSPMQTTQTYLKIDCNFILDARSAIVVRAASSSETIRLGFKVATGFNRVS